MEWLSRLLRRLFGRRPRPARTSPIDLGGSEPLPAADAVAGATRDPEPAPPPSALLPPELAGALELAPAAETVAFVEVEEEEQGFEEEERGAVALDDPEADLDSRPDLDVVVAERHSHLQETRDAAEREALSGERRIRLTDPAGPGTLAEALARLERDGQVEGRLEMDAQGEPVMVYTPVAAPAPLDQAPPSP